MARQQQKDYVFTPAGAGSGTVKIPGKYDISDVLTILNATDQIFIYNFADPDLGATLTWSGAYDSDFPSANEGVTTLTLVASTTTMSAGDSLAIYVETEAQYIRPWPFGTDAVERMRVANPQSLIDADFEYGLQNTKWQSLSLNNDIPSLYELPGSEFEVTAAGYVTFINAITSSGDTGIDLTNQTGTVAPNWDTNDYALVVNPYVAGANIATYLTANAVSSNQRTLTVNSSTGFVAGDDAVLTQIPAANQTTVSTGITSGATTSLVVSSASGFAIDQMIAVQTNTSDVWELMMITNIVSTTLTVVRRRLHSNQGNVNIDSAKGVRIVSNVEIVNVQTIDSASSISFNRGWMNTTPVKDQIAGSILTRINKEAGTSSGSNVEIVKLSTVGTAAGNTAIIARGQLGTTALSAAPEGSLAIRLTGIFQAGNGEINQVGTHIGAHGLTANEFISTSNQNNSNTEGLYQLVSVDTNYQFYYPRRLTSLSVGYPLNKTDTYIREAALFNGAALSISSVVTDGLSPSTITVTTPYAHGISPGTPLLVDITNSPGNIAYAEGSFTTLSIPSTTTFTYQAKSGKPVTGSITANVYVRPSAFFSHRPFDGGVLIGSGTPHHGAMAARQSKKYFRYQSGKGLVWTSGTLLSTNLDVVTVSAAGTGAGNAITVTTEVEHYMQIGANVQLSGVSTSGYNGYYRVAGITSDNAFTVTAVGTLGSATPQLEVQPKINLIGWHGASVRGGIFDEQNGAFWENNGVNVNVVLRSATFQLAGTLNLEVGSQLVTGDGNCRFLEQLRIYDRIVVRGMSHTVTAIADNNAMTVSPAWRGVSNQTRVKASRVIDRRVKQSDFNLDKVDGTGPSGYVLNASKMQMLLIQYTWYGAGFVDFGLRGALGNYVMCHRFQNNNVNDEAYMRSGNLPVRYSANNEAPTARLAIAANSAVTSLTIDSADQFPVATVNYPFYVQIENEVIKVQGHTAGSTTFTNCTRASAFTLWQDGSTKSFTMGTAASHSANVGVTLLDATVAPTLNHWGSAVIMDGGFDQDRGYAFTFNRNNIALPTAEGEKSTIFLMRLAPSVSNTIIGDIGNRDLINRAQLILENMIVNITGGRFVIEGILNPTNVVGSSIQWSDLNAEITGNQPSFTQFATAFSFPSGQTGGLVGAEAGKAGGVNRSGIAPSTSARYINRVIVGSTVGATTNGSGTGANISIAKTSTTSALVNQTTTSVTINAIGTGFTSGDTITLLGNLWSTSTTTDSRNASGVNTTNDVTLTLTTVSAGVSGGERLFALPINTTNSGFLDLSKVKQLGTSAIPGNNIYPDGPEVLAINITAATAGTAAAGDFQITFSETQA